MQTILGAGGSIANLLAKELKQYTDKVRLVARNPKQINGDDDLFKADLLRKDEVIKATEGATVVYLTVGLPYRADLWKSQWPVIMENVIEACLKNNCKLVFFDNVYMYDIVCIPNMTEDSSMLPSSQKGKTRAQLVSMIQNAIDQRNLKALIARSADFYGPGAANGILNVMITDNLLKGKRSNWQSDVNKIHSFTYVPDAAKATAMLGNTDTAFNQTWHLPTSTERLTGKELIELAAKLHGSKPSYFVLSSFLIKLLGMFSGTIKELYEMQYQYDRDYFFNSEKFNKTFNFSPTNYAQGIKETLDYKP